MTNFEYKIPLSLLCSQLSQRASQDCSDPQNLDTQKLEVEKWE